MSTLTEDRSDAKFMGVVKLSPQEWCRIPNNPRQRNTEEHAKRAKHLAAFDETHCRVAMAQMPDGSRVKLDGHTRAYLWEAQKLLPPFVIHADVYACETEDAAKEIYTRFDNKAAVETAADQLFGGVREAKLEFKSQLLIANRYTSALKNAQIFCSGKSGKEYSGSDTYELVDNWAAELRVLDQCDGTTTRFPSGVITAALMSFRKYGPDAAEFWSKYAKGEGSKIDGESDPAQALEEAILRLRQQNKFAGASNTNRVVGFGLSAFEGYRVGKSYGVKPKLLQPMQAIHIKNWIKATEVLDQD